MEEATRSPLTLEEEDKKKYPAIYGVVVDIIFCELYSEKRNSKFN